MHVLLVDDNATDLLLAGEAFAQADPGVRLSTTDSGPEALAALLAAPAGEEPDLVLIDLHMPGMDGFDLLARLRAHPRGHALPLVVMSTSSGAGDVQRAYALRASAYVVKPMEFAVFVDRLRALVTYWQAVIPAGHAGTDSDGAGPGGTMCANVGLTWG